MSRDRRRWVLELALLTGILLLVAVIVDRVLEYRAFREAIRNVGHFHEPNMQGERAAAPGRPHSLHEYVTDPGSVGRFVTYEFSTNALGLRDDPFVEQKPAGTFRVVIVGECVAYGPGVADDEIYPTVLEQLLLRSHPDRAIEVINGGRIAGSARDLARAVDREFTRFSPDLLLFSPGANTVFLPAHLGFEPLRMQLTEEEYQREMDVLRDALGHVLAVSRREGFALALITPTTSSFFFPDGKRWVDETVLFARENDLPVLDTTSLFAEAEAREGLLLERGVGLQRLVSTWSGDREVLLEVPFDDSDNTHHVAPEIYRYLDEHPDVAQHYSIDSNHPSADGHRLIALGLSAIIEEAGLL